jgi:hypothetical protein
VSRVDDWIEIVPPTDPITAEEKAKEWVSAHGFSDEYVVRNVRMDLLCAADGRSLRRYMVRKGALPMPEGNHTNREPSS